MPVTCRCLADSGGRSATYDDYKKRICHLGLELTLPILPCNGGIQKVGHGLAVAGDEVCPPTNPALQGQRSQFKAGSCGESQSMLHVLDKS
jgi:hypothetical protein